MLAFPLPPDTQNLYALTHFPLDPTLWNDLPSKTIFTVMEKYPMDAIEEDWGGRVATNFGRLKKKLSFSAVVNLKTNKIVKYKTRFDARSKTVFDFFL